MLVENEELNGTPRPGFFYVVVDNRTGDPSDDFMDAVTTELERGRVSYSVETLEELRATHPNATLDWIIVDDNIPQLGESIASLAQPFETVAHLRELCMKRSA